MPNYKKRQKSLQNNISAGSLLVSDPNDIFYYTGFRPTSLSFLIAKKTSSILYTSPLDSQAFTIKTIHVKPLTKFKDLPLRKPIGFDETHITTDLYLKTRKYSLKPASQKIKSTRFVKDSFEISQIKSAIRISQKAYKKTNFSGTEIQAARKLELNFLKLGSEKSFPTIIASGKNSANPHHNPTTKRISKKEMIIKDFGVQQNGYCTDTTRTQFDPRNRKQKLIYQETLQLQGEILDFLCPGMKVSEVQEFYEKKLKSLGHKILHQFGHPVGLEVHDPVPKTLEKNMVFTVEPGIYIKNFGGCRIEDMVLIGNRTKLLTTLER